MLDFILETIDFLESVAEMIPEDKEGAIRMIEDKISELRQEDDCLEFQAYRDRLEFFEDYDEEDM